MTSKEPMNDERLREKIALYLISDDRVDEVIAEVHQYAQEYGESLIGEDVKLMMNGKKIPGGKTVTIDMKNNLEESCKFIQENGKYIFQQHQRSLNKERQGRL